MMYSFALVGFFFYLLGVAISYRRAGAPNRVYWIPASFLPLVVTAIAMSLNANADEQSMLKYGPALAWICLMWCAGQSDKAVKWVFGFRGPRERKKGE